MPHHLAQDLFRQPKDDGCRDGDCAPEDVAAPIVARRQPAPVIELGEHVFDRMAGAIEPGLVGVLDGPVLPGCKAWCPAPQGPLGTRRCRNLGRRSASRLAGERRTRPRLIGGRVDLPFCQQQHERATASVGDGVQL